MLEELKLYIKNNYKEDIIRYSLSSNIDFDYEEDYEECANSAPMVKNDYNVQYKKSSTIDEYIKENNQYSDFQTMLFELIDERNLNDAEVYNKVHIDRRLFSKIRSDKNYHPSKETVILLGLSLELDEEELIDLLDSASYSLPKNNYYDLIIRFCFIKGIYKIDDVNNLLEQYNCKLFNY